MRFILMLLVAFCFSTGAIYAQVFDADTSSRTNQERGISEMENADENERLIDRVFFGGNVGAQFGNLTMINLAPMVGYKITDRWSIGTRLQYQYFRVAGLNGFDTHVFGGSGFSRFFLFDNFFAHAEYEVINGFFSPTSNDRVSIPHLFLGGGYVFRLNNNLGLGFTALYEVLQRNNSPYRNPIINAGITYGL